MICKKACIALSVALSTALAVPAVQAAPSAKHAVNIGTIGVMNPTNGWQEEILQANLKTASQKDVVASVSLECGLYTRTQVAGKKGQKSSATAHSAVQVAVFMDPIEGMSEGRMAEPGWVTFCDREQTLSATLGGVLESCDVTVTAVVDESGNVTGYDGSFTKDNCIFTEEDIELLLKTSTANSFDFVLPDVGTNGAEGHHLVVKARVATVTNGELLAPQFGDCTDSTDSSCVGSYKAEANASIGKGALVLQEIRLVKDAPVDAIPELEL